jgi:hypothetical protein
MNFLNSLSSVEITLLASSISISIAQDKTNDEINDLANLLMAIGQNLALITSHQALKDDIKQ